MLILTIILIIKNYNFSHLELAELVPELVVGDDGFFGEVVGEDVGEVEPGNDLPDLDFVDVSAIEELK